MLIPFEKNQSALKQLFNHYTERMKIGQVVCLTGGLGQKLGVGKSLCAIRLGQELDKNFTINRVCFTPSEFLKQLEVIENSGQSSAVIILDESEIAVGSHGWASMINKTMAHTIATSRYLRCVSVFVAPVFSSIDIRVRRLTSWLGYLDRFVKRLDDPSLNKSKVRLKLYQLRTNMDGDAIFYKKVNMFSSERKKVAVFRSFDVSMPREDLVREYEKKAFQFKTKLRKNLTEELERFEAKQLDKGGDAKQYRMKDLVAQALKIPIVSDALTEKGKVTLITLKSELENVGVPLTYFEAGSLRKMLEREYAGRS